MNRYVELSLISFLVYPPSLGLNLPNYLHEMLNSLHFVKKSISLVLQGPLFPVI